MCSLLEFSCVLDDFDINNFYFIDVQDNDENISDDHLSDARLSCFVHTLQLCIHDRLKSFSHIPKVLGKCQVLSKLSHKSSKIADILELLNKNINKNEPYSMEQRISINKVHLFYW